MLTLLLTSMLMLAFNVQLVKADPLEVIIDTEVWGTEFTAYPPDGYWIHVQDHDTFYTRAYAGNFWYTLCGAEGTGEPLYFGTWYQSLSQSGVYEVFVWIPNPDPFEYGGRVYTPTQSAIYQIYHKDGMTTRTVNQRLRTGGWYSIGTYTFDTSLFVILNDRTGEPYLSTMIAFDAIKFVYVNNPPTLSNGYVTPSSGDTSTTFSYYVTYSDPEGDVPTTKYVYVDDGSPYTMTKISGDYVSGAVFRYSTTLSAGSHNYYFYFDDGHGHTVRLPTSGTYSGPNVSPPPPQFDFIVGVSPSSGSVQQGGSVSATVTVTLTSGSTQIVSLTASGLPSGAYATFNPSSGYPTFTSTCTISTSTTTPTGTFYITIMGSGGGLTRTTTYTLTIPDFSISASPSSLTIQQGSSGSSTITVSSINGFNQPVQLTKSGAPSGVTATLNPQQVTPPAGGSKTCTLTVSVDATATPGSYPLTVTGTSGALSHNVRISLEITAAPPPEWTFAVITDLHIGRGYEEGTATFRHVSNYNDQDYYLTDRLQNVVKWIRDNAVAYNIKFVVITGDITEDGTQVEMHRANMTLAGLGNIPYFPVIGNHDLNNGGTSNFENEFNDAFFVAQCAKLDVTWENNRTNEVEAHLQNYAFRYKEKNFVFLDCVDRKAPWTAKLYASTLNVLTEFVDEGKPTILFSHHPMIQSYEAAFDKSEMDDLASAILGTKTLANFAGHIHGYFDQTKWFFDEHSFDSKRDAIQLWHGIEEYSSTPTFFNANGDYRDEGYETPGNIPVITTEAMMVGSNEPTPTEKGVIRLATVTGDTITSSEKGVFQSLNPHIICAVRSVPCLTGTYVYFQVYAFTKMFNTGRAIEYRLYIDGQLDDRIKYSSAIELKDFTAFLKYDTSHEVILTVTGYAPDGSQVVESIRRNVIVGKLSVILKCPVNIVVVDPIGRSISAESNEIPNATYVEADPDRDGNIEKFIEILAPIDGNYVIKLNGTDSGLYSMSAQFATSEDVLSFNATEIPVSLGAIHEFTIDWAALSQGDDGVTVNVDSNGDGTFEKIFIAGSELTRDEFMQHVFPVEAFPMWIAGVAFAAVAIVTITIAVFWRKRKQPSIKKPS